MELTPRLATREGRVDPSEAARGGGLPEDRYLSAVEMHEAAAALHGLAEVLDHLVGPFIDDAAEDAARLRVLAESLARWWPHPAWTPRGDGPDKLWSDRLRVYFARLL